jgi:hypothetical protein
MKVEEKENGKMGGTKLSKNIERQTCAHAHTHTHTHTHTCEHTGISLPWIRTLMFSKGSLS